MKEMATTEKFKAGKEPTEAQLSSFLREVPLIAAVPQEEINKLARLGKLCEFGKGNVIFRKGEPSRKMYFILSGYMMEFVGYGGSQDIIVKIRRAGEYIGEMGMLIAEPYPNTAVALEKLTLLEISRQDFLALVQTHFSVSQHIIKELIERLNNSCINMVNSMYLDAPGRLAFTIVKLSTNMGEEGTPISVTQNDLAASSGMARQTVAKVLGEWRRAGWIATDRGKLSIKNMEALLDVIVESELS